MTNKCKKPRTKARLKYCVAAGRFTPVGGWVAATFPNYQDGIHHNGKSILNRYLHAKHSGTVWR